MPTCDSQFVQSSDMRDPRVVCPGGHYKFDSCRDEALYDLGLDDMASSTGDGDFEGYLMVVLVPGTERMLLGEGTGIEREVIVPAGNYLVWTASSGAVTVSQADTEQQAQEIFDWADARYAAWEAGCDPNDLAGHADCEESCQRPGWMDAVR